MKSHFIFSCLTIGMMSNMIYLSANAANSQKKPAFDIVRKISNTLSNQKQPVVLTSKDISSFWLWQHTKRNKETKKEILTIPDKYTHIAAQTFTKCEKALNVIIPSSIESMSSAFRMCKTLESVEIKDGIERIGYGTFYDCTNLKDVIIPNSVREIGSNAFSHCEQLKDIVIPQGVTLIGSHAFSDAVIENLSINSSVTSIYRHAFDNCNVTNSITVACEAMKNFLEPIFKNNEIIVDSRLFHKEDSWKWPDDGHIIVATDKDMYERMFSERYDIKKVTIQDGVKSIVPYAFYGCKNLADINIANSVTSIGRRAFSDCKTLKTVSIPDSVTSIEEFAFSEDVFGGTISDRKYIVPCQQMKTYLCSSHGIPGAQIEIDDKLATDKNKWKWGENGIINIPSNVKTINNCMFFNRGDIKSVDGLDNIDRIGKKAFSKSGLVAIEIPENVVSLAPDAFRHCEDLESLTIPFARINSITAESLAGCLSLERLNIICPSNIVAEMRENDERWRTRFTRDFVESWYVDETATVSSNEEAEVYKEKIEKQISELEVRFVDKDSREIVATYKNGNKR